VDGFCVARQLATKYAVYWIEDLGSGHIDTNAGKYFEVQFCDVHGQRSGSSVRSEAQSYTGILEAYGIERSINYAKAIDILEDYIRVPYRGQFLVSDLWYYKLKLNGDTPEARAVVLAELDRFITDHAEDVSGPNDVLVFVSRQDWIPEETVDRLVKTIEAKLPGSYPRAFLLIARAEREQNESKRSTLMWELVDKYPDSQEADEARMILIRLTKDISKRERLYQQARDKNLYDPYLPLNMAGTYLDANQKLPEALTLLDQADRIFETSSQNPQATVRYGEAGIKRDEGRIAVMRADILVRLGRPREALAILLPRKSEFTLGSSFFVFGKALEGSGEKKAALNAYLEAAVRPSGDQRLATAALERLWSREKLGSKRDLQKRIEAETAQNFSKAEYVPRVLGHPAPEFDLTTLRGEHFTNSTLRGKKVVLNLWAVWCGPCLSELKAFQDFQEKHPAVVVLTLVDASTDPKQLQAVIRDEKLVTLRISRSSSQLWERLVSTGIPNTFLIDEAGYVRIQHLGSLPDVSRYFEADLKAIDDAGPVKKPDSLAAR
jgi:thiol-disulfide isomerase/thioredoxin